LCGKEVVELEHNDARLADQSCGRENGANRAVLPRIVLGRRSATFTLVVMMMLLFALLARWDCLRSERFEQRPCRSTEAEPQGTAVGKRRRHEAGRNCETARERQIGDVKQWVAWA
jgi:hypothetical protein